MALIFPYDTSGRLLCGLRHFGTGQVCINRPIPYSTASTQYWRPKGKSSECHRWQGIVISSQKAARTHGTEAGGVPTMVNACDTAVGCSNSFGERQKNSTSTEEENQRKTSNLKILIEWIMETIVRSELILDRYFYCSLLAKDLSKVNKNFPVSKIIGYEQV